MSIDDLNINDYQDIEIASRQLGNISQKEWAAYLAFASENSIYKKNFYFLNNIQDQLNRGHRLSKNQVFQTLRLMEQIDTSIEAAKVSDSTENALAANSFAPPVKNVTFRLAWHDSGWNGRICKDPEQNRYCSGYHSLLSDRIRKRKYEHLAEEIENRDQSLAAIEYLPPCFWSINLFGTEPFTVKHDNPAANTLRPIKETLPPYSVFSWPFAISFTRGKREKDNEGNYPGNLEKVRIPYFNLKIEPGKSIGFVYCNYSNPLTEEEGKYLIVGCGLIASKGDQHKFTPLSEIESIRTGNPKYKNFPETNWALRYSFDQPESMVSLPYHEYLQHCKDRQLSADEQANLLDSIKVAITEPELLHCFKYVAMDIDDDEAIYLLSKIKQKLLNAKTGGVVDPAKIEREIAKTNALLYHAWNKRGYFPGFENLCREILNSDELLFPLEGLLNNAVGEDDPALWLLDVLNDPFEKPELKTYRNLLLKLTEKLEAGYGIATKDFLQLCMLNLSRHQFKRILAGHLTAEGKTSHPVSEVSRNPYMLCEDYLAPDNTIDPATGDIIDNPIELFKIDIAFYPDGNFLDKVSLQRGFKYADKRRMRAVIIQHLQALKDNGDCFDDVAGVEKALKKYPLFYDRGEEYVLVKDFLLFADDDFTRHLEEKLVVKTANDTRYFYLQAIFNAEQRIGDIVHTLLRQPKNTKTARDPEAHIAESITSLNKSFKQGFDSTGFRDERMRLFDQIFKERLFLLTGIPGSGKSSELLYVINELAEQGESYLLLTPTGKAALRLRSEKKYDRLKVSTIDKLLEDVKNENRFRSGLTQIHNLIIDEMSMVDLEKFHQLLSLFNFQSGTLKRLILVGDPNQLPAIGCGKILNDILYFLRTHSEYNENFIELKTNCRMELADSPIPQLSAAFTYKGDFEPELIKRFYANPQKEDGLKIRYWSTASALRELMVARFLEISSQFAGSLNEKLNKLFGLESDGKVKKAAEVNLDNFQIITPYRGEHYGSAMINDFIQETFKSECALSIMDGWFKQGDKVMRTKNFYQQNDLVISNGSTGIASGAGKGNFLSPEVDFKPIPFKDFNKGEREFFDLAYCITIHKAQGSGFDHTFFVLPKKMALLSRELIYTALTRTKKTITLFIEGDTATPFQQTTLAKAQRRSFVEFRKTSLLLDQPFRFYSLEPEEGVFVASRIELLIYHCLMQVRERVGESVFRFEYEKMPMAGQETVPIKTDFTIYSNGQTWYWEHLGRLSDKDYAHQWTTLKYPTYTKCGLEQQLITTDELNGVIPARIEQVIQAILVGSFAGLTPVKKYSLHHYSLR